MATERKYSRGVAERRIHTCFIAHSFGMDIKDLVRVLGTKGIKALRVEDFISFGESISETIVKIISDSDMFILVLGGDDRSQANMYFELGVARALDKRILIFAPDRDIPLPFDIAEFLIVRAGPENTDATSFVIDQILAAPKARRNRNGHIESKLRPIGELSTELVERVLSLTSTGARPNESELMNIVIQALEAGGVPVVVPRGAADMTSDLAVWSEELRNSGAYPLLIEIKHKLSNTNLKAAIQAQLTRMGRAGSAFSMILYYHLDAGTMAESDAPPSVILMNVVDLIERLKDERFDEIFISMRNKVVHNQRIP